MLVKIKKIVILNLTFGILLCLISCTVLDEESIDIDLYPEKLTELTISGSFNPAILSINTSTDYSISENSENIGLAPSSLSYPSSKRNNNTPALFLEPNFNTINLIPSSKSMNPLKTTPYLLNEDPEAHSFYNELTKTMVHATKVATSNACVIYVETNMWSGSENLSTSANFVANITNALDYFTNTVKNEATTYLGDYASPTDVDGNGKIVILALSIPPEKNTAGFFWNVDLFSKSITGAENSNEKELLYININKIKENNYHHVIAHEYAHLLGATTRFKNGIGFSFDLWIEEGIAEGLSPIFSQQEALLQANFESLADTEISNGMGFLRQTTNTWYTYTLAYTFLEYCKLQMAQVNLYKDLITHSIQSSIADYKAIDSMIKSYNPSSSADKLVNFEDALISYKIANYIKHPSNKYGYKNSSFHTNNLPSLIGPSSSSTQLETSGSVYFIQGSFYSEESINSFIPSTSGDNIKFFRLIPQ